jgi:hypothetical protein
MTTAAASVLPARLNLPWLGWVNHYSMGLIFTFLSIAALVGAGLGHHLDDPRPWLIAGACATLAIVVTAIQWRRLEFTIYETLDDARVNYVKVMMLFEKRQWDVIASIPGSSISATVRAKWNELTWGDLITVLFAGSRVAINSIGNPYVGRQGSATWKGRAESEVREIANEMRVVI